MFIITSNFSYCSFDLVFQFGEQNTKNKNFASFMMIIKFLLKPFCRFQTKNIRTHRMPTVALKTFRNIDKYMSFYSKSDHNNNT